jgi:hypothetical protein
MSEAAPEAETPKARKRGVGTVVAEQLRAGATNDVALAAAKAEFPGSATTLATVSWYRNSLRGKGEAVPTAREAAKAAAPAPAEDAIPE